MKPEDYDWTIYHLLTCDAGCTMDDICGRSGYPPDIVEKSLERLRSSLLVERRGDRFRACSIEEFLITSRCNQDPFSDIFIEDGVVKVRSNSRSTSSDPGQRNP